MSNNTTTELLRAAILAQGGNVDNLPDKLQTTLLKRLVETCESADVLSGYQILRNTQTTTLADISKPAMWADGSWRKASGTNGIWQSIDIIGCPEPYIKKGWNITSNGNDPTVIQLICIAQNSIPLAVDNEYTLSCYAKGKGTLMLSCGSVKYESINSTEWVKCSHTFTVQNVAKQDAFFGVRYQGDSVDICGMKLEFGKNITEHLSNLDNRVSTLEAALLSLGGEA